MHSTLLFMLLQLKHGTRSRSGQWKRYKVTLKHNLKVCNIDPKELETLSEDRSSWRAMCKSSVQHFESELVAELKKKRSLRKAGRDRQLAALLASHVAASVLLGLVSTHTTELILIRNQKSVMLTVQSVVIIMLIILVTTVFCGLWNFEQSCGICCFATEMSQAVEFRLFCIDC